MFVRFLEWKWCECEMYVWVSGSYKPRRDIPLAVRELKTFSPSRIRDWIRDHRTEKDPKTKKRVQVLRTPDSIGKWLKRHPHVYEELKNEVIETELEQEAISETLFQNGFFQEVECIKLWMHACINVKNSLHEEKKKKEWFFRTIMLVRP